MYKRLVIISTRKKGGDIMRSIPGPGVMVGEP